MNFLCSSHEGSDLWDMFTVPVRSFNKSYKNSALDSSTDLKLKFNKIIRK